MPELRWGAATNPGRIRTDNEDTFVAESLVFAVADGMGGHQAGEVASALAAGVIRDRLGGGAVNEDAAVSAIAEANAAIHGAARANSAQSGMGTTLTALVVMSSPPTPGQTEHFVLLNVGDSRTYRFRAGRLLRVTVDHSYVQELVATGHITVEEARTHPRRNIVTRALGIEPAVRADTWTFPIVRGDRFILCSDGLVDEVPDSDILEFVESIEDPQQLAERLVDLANDNGGRDNVTVVVVDVLEGADPPDPTDEILVDPEWAAPVVAGAMELTDDPLDDQIVTNDSEDTATVAPLTVPVLATAPNLPPPAAPLPPDVEMTDLTADLTEEVTGVVEGEAAAPLEPTLPPTEPTLPPVRTAAVVVSQAAETTPGPATEIVEPPRRRFTFGAFLFVVAIAAIVTVTITFIAVHARSGYFVGFDGDTVVVYEGQSDSVLWFEPTVVARAEVTRDDLDDELVEAIESKPRFDSVAEADEFISGLVTPISTTTVPQSTTTTPTTSTATSAPGESTTPEGP